jgi:hypothetical protein
VVRGFYPKYRTSFGVKAGRKPQTGSYVSGVVRVADSQGKGYAFIRFPASFETIVGRAMPQGVGPETPVYLKVVEIGGGEQWRVFAHYLDESKCRLLWQSEEKPPWLNHIRRSDVKD